MSDSTDPITTLPGTVRAAPEGTPCDDCGKPATQCIQGKTDSFGAEMYNLCSECAAEVQLDQVDTGGQCDWCQLVADSRVPARDYEEGLSGRVYQVCADCLEQQQQRLLDEMPDDPEPCDGDE